MKKNSLDKKKFVEILKKHMEVDDFELKMSSYHIQPEMFLLHQQLLELYVSLFLSEEKAEWLIWWMYDADFGRKKSIANSASIKGRKFELETPEDFVKFLFDKRNGFK